MTEAERIALSDDSWVLYHAGWLGHEEARALEDHLRETMGWEQRRIVLFGKPVLQPRLVAWAGELPYRYSGQTLEPRPFDEPLAELRERIERVTGARFNHVLLNRYRDGSDSMGMHSDDEPELGSSPVVASISLGARRRFVLAPKKRRTGERRSIALEHGSLLVMGGATQHRFRHGLPKDPHVSAERINLTFRLVLRPPAAD